MRRVREQRWTDGDLPAPTTAVLLMRPLSRPGDGSGSVFQDDRWNLTPALFEEHARGFSIAWHGCSPLWKHPAKAYIWGLINDDRVSATANLSSAGSRLSVRTVGLAAPRLQSFLAWCEAAALTDLADFDRSVADKFLAHVLEWDVPVARKQRLVAEVQRLWHCRELVEAPLRLPDRPLWEGEPAAALVGGAKRTTGENVRPRIADATLQPLIVWSFRFVQDYAEDIVAAQRTWVAYLKEAPSRTEKMVRGNAGTLQARVESLISEYEREGWALPGRPSQAGKSEVDLYHLAMIIGCRHVSLQRYEKRLLTCGLKVDADTWALRQARGLLDGRPWLSNGIPLRDAAALSQHLSTACFILISYLSGMRPGEVLNLRRGCASTNAQTGISTINGTAFKGVTNKDGAHQPEGELRPDPWVVHEIVVRAVAVLERLHDEDLLFPRTLRPWVKAEVSNGTDFTRSQLGRPDIALNDDIRDFTIWVNDYCKRHSRHDVIPEDKHGSVTGSRFRRTLAWHIIRQPRGLVAAAIQYGHVHVAVTQGYGGGADSGFADEIAFEDWLMRVETISDLQASVEAGERVSGPAAAEFHRRVADADRRFAGRTFLTSRHADKALSNPSLQVYKARGMHCVMDADKAACVTTPLRRSSEMTPDLDGCKPVCPNIARTDSDIDELRADAERLQEVADDPLAPAIRTARERREAERLRSVIAQHERDRT